MAVSLTAHSARGHYRAQPEDIESHLASPLNAQDLSGLAPALLLIAEYDPSRDEAIEYCDALRAPGNDARHVPLPGLIHGAFWMSGAIPRASESWRRWADSSGNGWARTSE